VKEEKKDIGIEETRKQVLDMISAFSKGVITGSAKKEIESVGKAEKAPLSSASDVAQKIKDGSYAF
jgi:tryptophan synthase alpha subunit